jgi:hypothetical protein
MWGEDGESVPLVRGLQGPRSFNRFTYSEAAAERLAMTHSSRPGQRAEAATPEAPRTRRTIRHAQRGASFCNKG